MDPLDRPLADLIGHKIEILTACRCTKIHIFGPQYMVERMGPNVTLRIAAARMRCRACGARPTLTPGREWSIADGRDRRQNPPPLPEWVVPLLRR